MDQYVIKGGNPLIGDVAIGGAKNAALAILAMRILQQQYPEEVAGENAEEQLHAGMKEAFWQGRMQEIEPEIYFDGAHNTSGIGMFTEAVNRLTAKDTYRPLLLFSMVKKGLQYFNRYADSRYFLGGDGSHHDSQ